MKTLAIIQARMSSSRLPGKVLLEMGGKPMLAHVIERTRRAQSVDALLVATTTDSSDDPLAAFVASLGVACFRGSLHDVLDRYYQAARPLQPERLVRITADCPLIDPQLIDQTVGLICEPSPFNLRPSPFTLPPADFACNRLPPPFGRSFPIGLDVEACTFSALEKAWHEASQPFHREHVMPFLYEGVNFTSTQEMGIFSAAFGSSQRNFRIAQLHHRPEYGSLRWTVDTPEDLAFLREIFARLKGSPAFPWYDVLEIVQREPQLAQINAAVRHKTMTEVDERSVKK